MIRSECGVDCAYPNCTCGRHAERGLNAQCFQALNTVITSKSPQTIAPIQSITSKEQRGMPVDDE